MMSLTPIDPKQDDLSGPAWALAVCVLLFLVAVKMCGCSSAWTATPCTLDTRQGVLCDGHAFTFRCRPDPTGKHYPAGEVSLLVDGLALPISILTRDVSAICPLPGDATAQAVP